MRLAISLSSSRLPPSPPSRCPTRSSQEMRWRMIGPASRAGARWPRWACPARPDVFYIGVNNGGVWRSDDYGRVWTPIFDDQPTGSIGAIAVAPSDPRA